MSVPGMPALVRWLDGGVTEERVPSPAPIVLADCGNRIAWLQRFSARPLVYREVRS